MANLEQIHEFFPKAKGTEMHAQQVQTIEIPPTDLMLTTGGKPVLWIKAKKNGNLRVICVYTTIGADLTLALEDA